MGFSQARLDGLPGSWPFGFGTIWPSGSVVLMICMVPGFDDLRGLPDSLGFLFLWAYDPIGVLVLPVRLGSLFWFHH